MTKQEQLDAMLKDTRLLNTIDAPDFKDFEDDKDGLIEYIQERIYEHEVIYYHRAMEYLVENDPSLMESLELASEGGYEAGKLNSEILATLHIQQAMSEELHELDFDELYE
jgi:hypothetical protein